MDNVEVKDLAIATWRLEKWLENLNSERKMAAKSALRTIKKYVDDIGIEVIDPIGSKFDPGLAVEVINNESEGEEEESLIIIETISPYVYQNGILLQHAKVIIGTNVKESKANNEIVESDADGSSDAQCSLEASGTITTDVDDIEIDEKDIERMMKYAKIL